MLFNSGVFLKFFAAFLLLYWLVRNHLRARNILIVLASYLFYGWWDYRFLALLIFSNLIDYAVGLGISNSARPRQRKTWLTLSIMTNLIILGFFKYYDFFAASFAELLAKLNIASHPRTLGIILPVGISFYTFQALSYTIDVYRGNVPATRNLINFLAYVSFLPQLVAGPIERAGHMLPQFERTRSITPTMLEEGIWLMLWGMFRKVVVADNLDPLVTLVYGNKDLPLMTNPPAAAVVVATVAFGLQIYCDFAGYSEIARGLARVLGFDIMVNFNIPYVATNVREFWRRWHISLSTWLRDYLYISLGGNRLGNVRTYINLFLTMFLGGLWHGAAWNFVLWGVWHGAGLAVHRAFTSGSRRGAESRFANHVSRFVSWLLTMAFVFYGWLLFRARSLDDILALTRGLGHFSLPLWINSSLINLAAFALPVIAMEIWQVKSANRLAPLQLPRAAKAILQGALLLAIILFWEREGVPFIYFQF